MGGMRLCETCPPDVDKSTKVEKVAAVVVCH